MKNIILIVALAFIVSSEASARPVPPIIESREHLERAQTLLASHRAGGKGGIAAIISSLSAAETSLSIAKNDKGTALPVAKKLTTEAKSELEAAKVSERELHLNNADAAIKNALKHVMLGIQYHQ